MVTGLVVLACAGALHHIEPPPVPAVVVAPHTVPARALTQALTAEVALAGGDATQAEEFLKLALLHDPNSPWLWLRIAAVRSDINGRMAALTEAVRVGPTLPQTWAARGAANPDQQAALADARHSVELGETQEGRSVLCSLQERRDCVDAWARLPLQTPAQAQRRGLARLRVGDFEGAMADLSEALRAVGPEQWRLLSPDPSAVGEAGQLRPEQTIVNQRVRDAWISAVFSCGRIEEGRKILLNLETRWPGASMWTEMRESLGHP